MKKVIVLLYHGAKDENVNQKSVNVLTKMVKDKYPNDTILEVFTSKIVLARIDPQYKRLSVEEMLAFVTTNNFQQCIIIQTNIISSLDTSKIEAELIKHKINYQISKSLLEEDILKVSETLVNKINHEQVILVGHGNISNNEAYHKLALTLPDNYFVVTLVGKYNINEVIDKIDSNLKTYIYPLMFVNGFHAQRDVKGLSMELKNKIDEVYYVDYSLGMDEDILKIYVSKLDKLIKTIAVM